MFYFLNQWIMFLSVSVYSTCSRLIISNTSRCAHSLSRIWLISLSILQKMEAKSPNSKNILTEMIKQEMKYYIPHSTDLQFMFWKRRNYSGKFLLLKLFIRRTTTQTIQITETCFCLSTHTTLSNILPSQLTSHVHKINWDHQSGFHLKR
jgi:hypothetical protein